MDVEDEDIDHCGATTTTAGVELWTSLNKIKGSNSNNDFAVTGPLSRIFKSIFIINYNKKLTFNGLFG